MTDAYPLNGLSDNCALPSWLRLMSAYAYVPGAPPGPPCSVGLVWRGPIMRIEYGLETGKPTIGLNRSNLDRPHPYRYISLYER